MSKAKKHLRPTKAINPEKELFLLSENEEEERVLEKKTKDPVLLARLEQLEREIIERAKGRGFFN